MTSIIFISLLTIIASGIGTLSGFGVGTIMTSTLLLFNFPFSQTVLLVAIIHFFHDIAKIYFFHTNINWKVLFHFGLPSIIATFLGAQLVGAPPAILLSFMGVFLIMYSIMLIVAPHFHLKYTKTNALIGALFSGFFAGVFGIRGAIRSVFLSAYNFPKKMYISTIGAISFLLDSTRISVYLWKGIRLGDDLMFGLTFFIIASFIGSFLGARLVRLVPQEQFRKVVAFFLLVVGIRLLATYFVG